MECTLNIDAAMEQLFGIPASEVLAQAFWLGLSTPLVGYLAAYFVGLFISMFRD